MTANTPLFVPPEAPQVKPPPKKRTPMEIAALVADYVKAGMVHAALILLAAATIGGLFIGLKGILFLVDKCSRALGG